MSEASVSVDELRSRFEKCGQGHVFDYYDELDDDEKSKLVKQLRTIQVEQLSTILEAARNSSSSTSNNNNEENKIQPFAGPVGRISTADDENTLLEQSRSIGMDAIRQGHVAAIVLAGGQGTRLGFDGPKGMYDIGLPSKRTLFQMMAERIKKLSDLAAASSGATTTTSTKKRKLDNGSANGDDDKDVAAASDKVDAPATATIMIPFYIMTSPLNHDATVEYFRTNKYFGLGQDNVKFFQQGTLPCLSNETDGKIMLESKNVVAMAPDGNGGIYPSLSSSGMLDDMASRGVQYLHVYSIDNALIKPADPVFIGYCISQNADCGNKVVWKAHPHEAVGVIASRGGKPCVVEYSEITKEMAEMTNDEDGVLVYGAANICNHFYTLDFIRNKILPNLGNYYHIAKKKIPYWDKEKNETITPTTNNGIKLETFIFDVFPLSERMAVLEAKREEEFAPVKNAPGSKSDSPDTARALISALCKDWVQKAGGTFVTSTTGDDDGICEIAPSTSYAGEGLEDLVKGKSIECPFTL